MNVLCYQIGDFEKKLNKDEEVGAYLASFGTEILVQIESVGYQNPYIIIFNGINTNDGSAVRLIQHTTQINLLFTAIKIKNEREPKRIGFVTEKKEND